MDARYPASAAMMKASSNLGIPHGKKISAGFALTHALSPTGAVFTAAALSGAMNPVIVPIQQSVTSRWIIPATARGRDDLRASVRVTLLPGGEVLDIKLIKGSGDRAFDDSLQGAVRAASPLPVPSGQLFHESFRVMTMEFDPGMKK